MLALVSVLWTVQGCASSPPPKAAAPTPPVVSRAEPAATAMHPDTRRKPVGSRDGAQAPAHWFTAARADRTGSIPPGVLARARDQMRDLEARGILSTAPQGVAAAGPSPQPRFSRPAWSDWSQIGPAPIYVRDLETYSGRINAVAPLDDQHWYVGAAGGGIWRTRNGGTGWTPLTDHQPTLSIATLTLDPAPDKLRTVWAGTGERCGSYGGAGILMSTDQGETWTQVGASVFGSAVIPRIAIDPTSPTSRRILYAAANAAGSSGGGGCGLRGHAVASPSSGGLARSTDGGQTWAYIRDATGVFGPGASSSDVVVDLDGRIYATRVFGTEAQNGIYRSDGGGATFQKLVDGLPTRGNDPEFIVPLGWISLALAPTNSKVLYAVIAQGDEQLVGVYRTEDGGNTWSRTAFENALPNWNARSVVKVAPDNFNRVFVGSVNLFQSFDGGAIWFGTTANMHVDITDLAFLPFQASAAVLVASDGGLVHLQLLAGPIVTSKNGVPPSALAITQGYRGAAHPFDRDKFYVGTQDTSGVIYSGAIDWMITGITDDRGRLVRAGDGGYAQVDLDSPDTAYVALNGYPFRTDDGGFNWTPKYDGVGGEQRSLVAPLVMDPTRSQTLYLGTTRVYRTIDRGEHWTPLTATALSTRSSLTALAVSNADPNRLYTGDAFGLVWTSPDGGAMWVGPFAQASGLPGSTQINEGRYLTDLAAHPRVPDVAYATYAGFNGHNAVSGHVFRTRDAGQTWTNLSAGLPDVPVNSISIDPLRSETLYVATDLGVFVSNDEGLTWATLNAGLPNVPVMHVVMNRAGYLLYAVTWGRSVYRAERLLAPPGPPSALTALVSGRSVTLQWQASTTGDPPTTYVIDVGFFAGKSLASFDTRSTATSVSAAGVPAGLYFIRVKARNNGGTSDTSNEVSLAIAPD